MTDETYQRVRAHVLAHSTPPCDLFPDGLGIPIVVSWERERDDPLLEPGRITLCMADYTELVAHADAETEALRLRVTLGQSG